MGRYTNTSQDVELVSSSQMSSALFASNQSDNSRIVMLHGDVSEHLIASVIMQLLQLANLSHDPIHLVVSTYGGSVDEMFSLYDMIKFLPCPVRTIALGKVMSAGVLLLASGEKGKRLIGRSARIMIHPISSGMYGNVFEIANDMIEYERMQELLVGALCSETNLTRDDVDKIMKKGHDHYITPEQAIKMGIVDKIVGD